MPVDTNKVKDRRTLRFNSPGDVLRDVEQLAAAERAGTLRRSGNWTLGQNLNHLTAWINYAFDGFPLKAPPFFIRWLLKLRKSKFLNESMPQGIKIPGVPGGTLSFEPIPSDEGARQYAAAWQRLEKNAPTLPNLIFGPMTHEEWIKLNLRHAELHLGYLHPR